MLDSLQRDGSQNIKFRLEILNITNEFDLLSRRLVLGRPYFWVIDEELGFDYW
jgi:hypothetical protein